MDAIVASKQVAEAGAQASTKRARSPEATVEKRAARAPHTVGADGRVEFWPASIGRGRIGTERRPPEPRDPMPRFADPMAAREGLWPET